MTATAAANASFKDLLVDELRDLYDAENQLLKALPKIAKAASNAELKQGFEQHLEQTKGHVVRLERAFQILSTPIKRKTCQAMKGLVEESNEALGGKWPDEIRDANIIGAAQRVEHYEIAAYGTARAFAQALQEQEVAVLLQETLDEESATDKKLTAIAASVNAGAAAVSSGATQKDLEGLSEGEDRV